MLAQGATPLLRAARGGDDKFVALLLEYKALVDLPSKEGDVSAHPFVRNDVDAHSAE